MTQLEDNKKSVLEYLPESAEELINGLAHTYPPLVYTPGDTLEHVAYYAGIQKVILDLQAALERKKLTLALDGQPDEVEQFLSPDYVGGFNIEP